MSNAAIKILQHVPTIPKLKIGDNRTSVHTAKMLERDTYFVILSTVRNTIPTMANTQKPKPNAYPNITDTALPPLKFAKIGKQCPITQEIAEV